MHGWLDADSIGSGGGSSRGGSAESGGGVHGGDATGNGGGGPHSDVGKTMRHLLRSGRGVLLSGIPLQV